MLLRSSLSQVILGNARINEIRKQGFVLEAAKATASAAATDIADLSELQTGSVLANQAQLLIIQQADNALQNWAWTPPSRLLAGIQKILSQEQFSRMVTQSARGELRGMMALGFQKCSKRRER